MKISIAIITTIARTKKMKKKVTTNQKKDIYTNKYYSRIFVYVSIPYIVIRVC